MQKCAKIGDSEKMNKTEDTRDSPKTMRKNRKLSRICNDLIGEEESHGRSADNSFSGDLVSQQLQVIKDKIKKDPESTSAQSDTCSVRDASCEPQNTLQSKRSCNTIQALLAPTPKFTSFSFNEYN